MGQLNTDEVINAAMQRGRGLVDQVAAGNAITLDNEDCRVGLVRKIRRIIFHNRDNAVRMVTLYTGTLAVPGATALPRRCHLINYGYFVWEPEKPTEQLAEFVASVGNTRLQAIVDGVTTGIETEVDYFDDLVQ